MVEVKVGTRVVNKLIERPRRDGMGRDYHGRNRRVLFGVVGQKVIRIDYCITFQCTSLDHGLAMLQQVFIHGHIGRIFLFEKTQKDVTICVIDFTLHQHS